MPKALTLDLYLHHCRVLYLSALVQRHKGHLVSMAKEAGRHRSDLFKLLRRHGFTGRRYSRRRR